MDEDEDFLQEPVFIEEPPRPRLNSCGLPLLSSEPLERWKREQEARSAQRAAAKEELRAREEKMRGTQAMADAFVAHVQRGGFNEMQIQILGRLLV